MYDIRLKQIECFLDITQTMNFTSTAKRLHISQPLVSKWIKSIEDELNIKLFVRGKDGLYLTKEGAFLRDRWANSYPAIIKAIDEMRLHTNDMAGEISIGYLERYENDAFLREIVNAFSQKHPQIALKVTSYGISELVDHLHKRDLDVAFHTTLDLDSHTGLYWFPLHSVDFYIAISANHRLSQRSKLSMADLKHESFFAIAEKESPSGGRRILAACEKAGFKPRSLQYVPNLSSLALSIIYQNGVTLTGKEIVNGYEDQIRLYETAEIAQDESMALLWRKKEPGVLALKFAEFTSRYVQQGEKG